MFESFLTSIELDFIIMVTVVLSCGLVIWDLQGTASISRTFARAGVYNVAYGIPQVTRVLSTGLRCNLG